MVRLIHPDKNGGVGKERFQVLHSAFEVLWDEERRAAYDVANPTHGLHSVRSYHEVVDDLHRIATERNEAFTQRYRAVMEELGYEVRSDQLKACRIVYHMRKSLVLVKPCAFGKSIVFWLSVFLAVDHTNKPRISWNVAPSKELCENLYNDAILSCHHRPLLVAPADGGKAVLSHEAEADLRSGKCNYVVSTARKALKFKKLILELDKKDMLANFSVDEIDTSVLLHFMLVLRKVGSITRSLINTPMIFASATVTTREIYNRGDLRILFGRITHQV